MHNLTAIAPVVGQRKAYPCRAWRDARGRVCVEDCQLTGMGHATPLGTAIADYSESAGAFLFDVGLSSTLALARAWGLLDEAAIVGVHRVAQPRFVPVFEDGADAFACRGQYEIQKISGETLRSTGLMR